MRNDCKILIGNPEWKKERKKALGKIAHWKEDNIKVDLKYT